MPLNWQEPGDWLRPLNDIVASPASYNNDHVPYDVVDLCLLGGTTGADLDTTKGRALSGSRSSTYLISLLLIHVPGALLKLSVMACSPTPR